MLLIYFFIIPLHKLSNIEMFAIHVFLVHIGEICENENSRLINFSPSFHEKAFKESRKADEKSETWKDKGIVQ